MEQESTEYQYDIVLDILAEMVMNYLRVNGDVDLETE